jgi:integrase
MQNGSLIRAKRQCGPEVWEFRWREPDADGRRKHRRIVLGSVEQLVDETAARQAISVLRIEFNRDGAWLKTRSTTFSDLVSHYCERELDPDTVWKTHSTKVTYEGYLNKWILPRWERYPLDTRQRWRGRALVEIVAAGQIKLRQNQKSHERSVQSWNPI